MSQFCPQYSFHYLSEILTLNPFLFNVSLFCHLYSYSSEKTGGDMSQNVRQMRTKAQHVEACVLAARPKLFILKHNLCKYHIDKNLP